MDVSSFIKVSERKLSLPEETIKSALDLIAEIREFLHKPIDKHNLDGELEKISAYFDCLSELLPEYSKYRDFYHEQCKFIWSELDEEIRLNYENLGKKVTEKMIENEIIRNEVYRECKKHFLKFKYLTEVIEAMLNSFRMRKSNIDLLAQLYAQGYWSMIDSITSNSRVVKNKKLEEAERLLERIQKGDEEVFEE